MESISTEESIQRPQQSVEHKNLKRVRLLVKYYFGFFFALSILTCFPAATFIIFFGVAGTLSFAGSYLQYLLLPLAFSKTIFIYSLLLLPIYIFWTRIKKTPVLFPLFLILPVLVGIGLPLLSKFQIDYVFRQVSSKDFVAVGEVSELKPRIVSIEGRVFGQPVTGCTGLCSALLYGGDVKQVLVKTGNAWQSWHTEPANEINRCADAKSAKFGNCLILGTSTVNHKPDIAILFRSLVNEYNPLIDQYAFWKMDQIEQIEVREMVGDVAKTVFITTNSSAQQMVMPFQFRIGGHGELDVLDRVYRKTKTLEGVAITDMLLERYQINTDPKRPTDNDFGDLQALISLSQERPLTLEENMHLSSMVASLSKREGQSFQSDEIDILLQIIRSPGVGNPEFVEVISTLEKSGQANKEIFSAILVRLANRSTSTRAEHPYFFEALARADETLIQEHMGEIRIILLDERFHTPVLPSAQLIARLKDIRPSGPPLLFELLQTSSTDVRAAAAREICKLGIIRSPEERPQWLKLFGGAQDQVVPTLLSLLHADADSRVQREYVAVAKALDHLGYAHQATSLISNIDNPYMPKTLSESIGRTDRLDSKYCDS